jgi:hypothetical protein
MKKIYVLTLLMAVSCWLSAQTFLSEDFSSGNMPPAGWTFDGYPAQWSNEATNQAGGTAPEAMFSYIDIENATSRFISPLVDLTGVPDVALSFQHYYDFYDLDCFIGVATRFGTGAWTSIWEIEPGNNIGPETRVIQLTGVGQPDFQFCLYITGNLYNVDYWYIDDIKLFIPLALDAKLKSLALPSYAAIGAQVDVKGIVSNEGTSPINSFDISYNVNGGAPQVYSVSGLNLALGETYSFTHNIPFTLNEAGTYMVVTDVENVNGTNDMYPANDSLTSYVGAVTFIPTKKVFAEEATGTWCGWCVRGICFMDYMAETYPETWIGVGVHNGDPMVVPEYDDAIANIIPNFPGFPSGTIDRSGDNYYDPSDFEAGYLERINAISPASIDIVNYSWDATSRVVSFDLQSEFVVDVNNELRFAVVISEDSLWGTSSGWNQGNYYSGGGQGPMCGFENMPGTIPAADMHYDHVAREILDSPYGTENSLPLGILAGEVHSYNYTYTIPQTWRYDKLHFIGLIIDMATGEVLNANNVISSYVGIKEKMQDQSIRVYPNPFADLTNLEFSLNKASVVKVDVCDFLGKTVYSEAAREYPDGNSKIQILSGNMSSGVYLIKLTIDNQTYTRKISVVK